jgi:hypothetical protein
MKVNIYAYTVYTWIFMNLSSAFSLFLWTLYLELVFMIWGARGGSMAEGPRYKPEGRGSIPDGFIGIFH